MQRGVIVIFLNRRIACRRFRFSPMCFSVHFWISTKKHALSSTTTKVHFTLKKLLGRIRLGMCSHQGVYGDCNAFLQNFRVFAVADLLFLFTLDFLINHYSLEVLSKTFRKVKNQNIYMVGSILSYSETRTFSEYLLHVKHLMKYLHPLGHQASKGH